MRTRSAADQAVWSSGTQGEHLRVWVKDGGGTFRDLTTYAGFNAVKACTIAERIEDPHPTADVTLVRQRDRLNFAPLVSGSAINRGFDPFAAYSPLVQLNREVKIEVSIVPADKGPNVWMEIFRGRIDKWDQAGFTFGCRGLSGRLAQQFIKTERVYSFAEVSGSAVPLLIFEPSGTYAVNQYILPASRGTGDSGAGKFYKVTAITTGIAGSVEPTWPSSGSVVSGGVTFTYQGTTTTAGNPVEEILQNILDDNRGFGDGAVTLYTPSSPGWMIRQFIQRREFTLDGIRKLAQQIGWDVRFKWRTSSSQFELTFYEPERVSPTVNAVFETTDYKEIEQLSVDIQNIRNAWRVIYSDASDLMPDGTPKRKIVEVSDVDSIVKYGELWAEIAEEDTSQIDSDTEATALANAALSDCAEPTAELKLKLTRGWPHVELNDYYGFMPGTLPTHFDAAQYLAVTGYEHRYEGGKLRTSLELRGKPTIGATIHIEKATHGTKPLKQPHQLTDFPGATTPAIAVSATVGGARAIIDYVRDKNAHQRDFEYHVGPTANFDPDGTTLEAVTQATTLELANLKPGQDYYFKAVPRSLNGVRPMRGQPSAAVAFTAGRAIAAHLSPEPDLTRLPLNGGFETSFDGVAADHWKAIDGVSDWGAGWALISDGNGVSGSNYIQLDTTMGDTAELQSAIMQVDDGYGVGLSLPSVYILEWLELADYGTGNHYIDVQWLDDTQALISTDSYERDNSAGGWLLITTAFAPPAGAKYARIHIRKKTASDNFGIFFDQFRFRRAQPSSQLLFGSSVNPNTVQTYYLKPGGPYAAAAAIEPTIPAPFTGVIHSVSAYGHNYGGPVGQVQYTFTVRVNGVDTGIVFTLGSTSGGWPALGFDGTNFALVQAGDTISVKMVSAIGGAPIAPADIVLSMTLER